MLLPKWTYWKRNRKRMIIWRETGTFEITEQRLVDQARVIRTNEWLSEVELEEITRKNFNTQRW